MVVGRAPGLLAQLRRGVLEYCVLAILEHGERYAFDLVREMSDGGEMATSEGTVYPLLARLRREGSVESSWSESSSGPPRRYYRVTPKGRRALKEFRAEWSRFRRAVDGIVGEGASHD